MLRTCVAAAAVDGRVCVFLEPIALYHTRDLYDRRRRRLAAPYDRRCGGTCRSAAARATRRQASDLTIVTFGNGRADEPAGRPRRLADERHRRRVVDLRWLAPLPVDDLLREAAATGRVLVVDETRRSGGVGEGVLAALVDAGFAGPIARVASAGQLRPARDRRPSTCCCPRTRSRRRPSRWLG